MNVRADTMRGTVLSPNASRARQAPARTMADDASAARPSAGPALAGPALVVVLVAQLVVVLDFSIVNVALPSIATDLGASSAGVEWVVTAYAITFGGLLVLGGRAADLIGRQRLFVRGLIAFGAASAVGGLAPSLPVLVGARAMQGVAAAAVAPAALSILTTSFPEGRARTRVLGYYGMLASVGFVLGLVLGGVLVDSVGWRGVFYVNVPICIVAAALGRRLIPVVGAPASARPHLDVAGALLVTSGLAVLVYAPTAGTDTGWRSTRFVAALALSGGLLAAFLYQEHRSAHPLLPLSMLRARTLAGGDVVAFLVGAWLATEVLVLALFLQDNLGYSALAAGLIVIPQGVGGVARGVVGASAVARLGLRRFLALNAALAAVGLALLLRFPATSHGVVLALVLLVIGFGSTNVMLAATVAASTGVPNEEQGVAGGLVNTTRQVGAALGVAALLSVAQAGDGGSSITPASGYRLAMGVASGLAVVASAVALVLVPDQRTTGRG